MLLGNLLQITNRVLDELVVTGSCCFVLYISSSTTSSSFPVDKGGVLLRDRSAGGAAGRQ